jgi:hypothetical protein
MKGAESLRAEPLLGFVHSAGRGAVRYHVAVESRRRETVAKRARPVLVESLFGDVTNLCDTVLASLDWAAAAPEGATICKTCAGRFNHATDQDLY